MPFGAGIFIVSRTQLRLSSGAETRGRRPPLSESTDISPPTRFILDLLYWRIRPGSTTLIDGRSPRPWRSSMSSPSPVDPDQRFVTTLESNALSLFVVSIVGGALSLVIVGLRTFVRLRAKNFGLDDGLMLGGLVSNTSGASGRSPQARSTF